MLVMALVYTFGKLFQFFNLDINAIIILEKEACKSNVSRLRSTHHPEVSGQDDMEYSLAAVISMIKDFDITA